MRGIRTAREKSHPKNVLTNKKNDQSQPTQELKDKDNNIVFEKENILKRWTEYISELFIDDRAEEIPLTNIPSEQLDREPILLSEIRNTLKKYEEWQSMCGNDKIVKEMIEAREDFGVEKVCEIANCIYNTGKIPRQMRVSIFMTLPKRGDLLLCSNYWLICLMSHITKIILRVVMAKPARKLKEGKRETRLYSQQEKDQNYGILQKKRNTN